MIHVLLVLVLLTASMNASADEVIITKDYDTAQFSWDWTQGTGGTVREFRLYCKSIIGETAEPITQYPFKMSVNVRDAQRLLKPRVAVNRVIPGPGRYSCEIKAWNQAGESGASNKITFDVVRSKKAAAR